MLWILEMVVVIVVANYAIRAIDRLVRRDRPVHRERPAVGTVVPSRRKESQTWNSTEPLKFPRSHSRAS